MATKSKYGLLLCPFLTKDGEDTGNGKFITVCAIVLCSSCLPVYLLQYSTKSGPENNSVKRRQ